MVLNQLMKTGASPIVGWGIVVLFGIMGIVIHKPIERFIEKMFGKKKEKYREEQVNYKNEYDVPVAPKIDFEKLQKEIFKDEALPQSNLKETLGKLNDDIRESRQKMVSVLKKVTSVQTDIFKKMKDYYETGKDLEDKEKILRLNIRALEVANPSIEMNKKDGRKEQKPEEVIHEQNDGFGFKI